MSLSPGSPHTTLSKPLPTAKEGVLAVVKGNHPHTSTVQLTDAFGPGSVVDAIVDLVCDAESMDFQLNVDDLTRRVQLCVKVHVQTSDVRRVQLAKLETQLEREASNYEIKLKELESADQNRLEEIKELQQVIENKGSEIRKQQAEIHALQEDVRHSNDEVAMYKKMLEKLQQDRAKEMLLAAEHEKLRQREREEILKRSQRRAQEAAQDEERKRRQETERVARVYEMQQLQQEREERERERVLEREREVTRQQERAHAAQRDVEWRVHTMKLLQEIANCAKCADRFELASKLTAAEQKIAQMQDKCDALTAEVQELREREHALLHPTVKLTNTVNDVAMCTPSVGITTIFSTAFASFAGCAHIGSLLIEIIEGGHVDDTLTIDSGSNLKLVSEGNQAPTKVMDSRSGLLIGYIQPKGNLSAGMLKITFTPEIGCVASDVTLLLQNVVMTVSKLTKAGTRKVRTTLTIHIKESTGALKVLKDEFHLNVSVFPTGLLGVSDVLAYSDSESCMPFASLGLSTGATTTTSWEVQCVDLVPRGVVMNFEILRDLFCVESNGELSRGGVSAATIEGRLNGFVGKDKQRALSDPSTSIKFLTAIDPASVVSLIRGLRIKVAHSAKIDKAFVDVVLHVRVIGIKSAIVLSCQLNFVSDMSSIDLTFSPDVEVKSRACPKQRGPIRTQVPFQGILLNSDVRVVTTSHDRLGTGRVECSVINAQDGDFIFLSAAHLGAGLEVQGATILQEKEPVATLSQSSASYLQISFLKTGVLTAATVQAILRSLQFVTDSVTMVPREVHTFLTVGVRTVAEVPVTVTLQPPLVTASSKILEYHEGDVPQRVAYFETRDDDILGAGVTVVFDVPQGGEESDVLDVRRDLLEGGLSVTEGRSGQRVVVCDDEVLATLKRGKGTLQIRFQVESSLLSKSKRRVESTRKARNAPKVKLFTHFANLLRAVGYHNPGIPNQRNKVIRAVFTDCDGCITDILISVRVIAAHLTRSTSSNIIYSPGLRDTHIALCKDADLNGLDFDVAKPKFVIRVECIAGFSEGDVIELLPPSQQAQNKTSPSTANAKVRRRQGSFRKLNVSDLMTSMDAASGNTIFYVCAEQLLAIGGGLEVPTLLGTYAMDTAQRFSFTLNETPIPVVQALIRTLAFAAPADARGTKSFVIHVKAGRDPSIDFDFRIQMDVLPPLIEVSQIVPLDGLTSHPCARLEYNNIASFGITDKKLAHCVVKLEVIGGATGGGVDETIGGGSIVMASLELGLGEDMALTTTAPRALYHGKTFLAEVDTDQTGRIILTTTSKSNLTWQHLVLILGKVLFSVSEPTMLTRLVKCEVDVVSIHQSLLIPVCVIPGAHTPEHGLPTLHTLYNEINVPVQCSHVRVGKHLYLSNNNSAECVIAIEVILPRMTPLQAGLEYLDFSKEVARRLFTVAAIDSGCRISFLQPPNGTLVRQILHSIIVSKYSDASQFGESCGPDVDVTVHVYGMSNEIISTQIITLHIITNDIPTMPDLRLEKSWTLESNILPDYVERRNIFLSGSIIVEISSVHPVSAFKFVSLRLNTMNAVFIDNVMHHVVADLDHVVGTVEVVPQRIAIKVENTNADIIQRIIRSVVVECTGNPPVLEKHGSGATSPVPPSSSSGGQQQHDEVVLDVKFQIVDGYDTMVRHVVTYKLKP